MDEYLSPKMLKTGFVLYALIFLLIGADMLSDYQEGLDWGHISIELLVLICAVVGLTLLGRFFYQSTKVKFEILQIDLTHAKQEAERWRAESHGLLQGLGVEIQKQFSRWGLTQAESEIGLLILKGFSHQEIANIRGASERTVREQARVLYRKAGLAGKAELSAFFLEDLLLPTETKK
jgi:DNA-binding CsgD family transcriptional regulator